MEKTTEWMKKYFTDEQLQTMAELGSAAHSPEALARLQGHGEWTEADQEKATADWTRVYLRGASPCRGGADPGG